MFRKESILKWNLHFLFPLYITLANLSSIGLIWMILLPGSLYLIKINRYFGDFCSFDIRSNTTDNKAEFLIIFSKLTLKKLDKSPYFPPWIQKWPFIAISSFFLKAVSYERSGRLANQNWVKKCDIFGL